MEALLLEGEVGCVVSVALHGELAVSLVGDCVLQTRCVAGLLGNFANGIDVSPANCSVKHRSRAGWSVDSVGKHNVRLQHNSLVREDRGVGKAIYPATSWEDEGS